MYFDCHMYYTLYSYHKVRQRKKNVSNKIIRKREHTYSTAHTY